MSFWLAGGISVVVGPAGRRRRYPTRRARFKTVVPHAHNYADLGLNPYDPNFALELEKAMREAKRIHFDVTGMKHLNTPDGVLRGEARLNPPGSTNWELRTIWDDPVLRAKTTFRLNGNVVSPDDLLKLD